MKVLSIDTSNEVLGVAITEDDKLIAQLVTNTNKDHSSRLMPAITDLFEKAALTPADLGKIVVAGGPGSYTGTRIGVTTAKTMAWALDIPIYQVSSLELLAYNGRYFNGLICPFFNARRGLVFTGLYRFDNGKLEIVREERNMAMDAWLEEILTLGEQVMFLSPHLAVFEEMIGEKAGELAVIPEATYHLPNPANLSLLSKQYEVMPVHQVSPNYLRVTEAEANLQQG